MEYRSFNIVGLLIALFLVTGCSSPTPDSREVMATEVYGKDSHIISIAPGKYEILKKDGRLRLKIKLKLEETAKNDVGVYPEVILMDEDGVEIIDGWYQMEMSDSEKNKFNKFVKGEVGDEKEFVFQNEFDADYFNDVMTKSSVFSVDKLQIYEDSPIESDTDEELDKTIEQTKEIIDATKDVMEMSNSLLELVNEY